MRQILIDHARIRDADKRGGGARKLSLDLAAVAPSIDPSRISALDGALEKLAKTDALKAQLVELRFFGGMTAEESAEYLKISVHMVRRHLRVAQAWLRHELEKDEA
jgi:RNA polymerase sigma factor (TIGR02999 family)